jgi:3-methyladenine DNA glycosylase Tag
VTIPSFNFSNCFLSLKICDRFLFSFQTRAENFRRFTFWRKAIRQTAYLAAGVLPARLQREKRSVKPFGKTMKKRARTFFNETSTKRYQQACGSKNNVVAGIKKATKKCLFQIQNQNQPQFLRCRKTKASPQAT